MKLLVSIITAVFVTLTVASEAVTNVWTYYDPAGEICNTVGTMNDGCTVQFNPEDFYWPGDYFISKVFLTSMIPAGQTVTLIIADHYLHADPLHPRFYQYEFTASGAEADTFTLVEPLPWLGPFYVRLDYEPLGEIPFPSSWSEDAIRRNQVHDVDEGWTANVCDFAIGVVVNGLTDIGENGPPLLPRGFTLLQNFPNPFNPQTTISFQLPKQSEILLGVYDLRGQLVKMLVSENREAGTYQVFWNGTDEQGSRVPSGLYLYRLQTPEFTITKKMVLLK